MPYVDPGLPLARQIAARRDEYTVRSGKPAPKITFLMNHGLIVSGDDPAQIRTDSHRVMRRIERAVAAAGGGLPAIAERFREAVGARYAKTDASTVATDFPVTEAGSRFLEQGPLIPDQIVYAGSFPLVLNEDDDVPEAVRNHRETHGTNTIIAVVPGSGVIAIGEDARQAATALEVYVDSLVVAQAAATLGSVRTLGDRERSFIETWEAEAYRKKIAAE